MILMKPVPTAYIKVVKTTYVTGGKRPHVLSISPYFKELLLSVLIGFKQEKLSELFKVLKEHLGMIDVNTPHQGF